MGSYDAQDRLTLYCPRDAQAQPAPIAELPCSEYSYRATGQLLTQRDLRTLQTTIYDYDELGGLRHVTLANGTVIEYELDPTGRRVGKRVNGQKQWGLLYQDALRPIAQLNPANQVVATFTYGTRANVPDTMQNGGQLYRYVVDQIGSVRLVVSVADGHVAQRIDYDEFGRVLVDTNPGFQPFGFAGGLYDADTGLVRFGARDYDATVGRWTAKDPWRFGGGDTNFYVYSQNDSINFVDFTGQAPTRAEVAAAYEQAYDQWWQNRPDQFRTWGPISNWKAFFGEDAPVCSDYAEAAADAMNSAVDIPGTGAYAVWDFQQPTDQLGVFENTNDIDLSAHNTVEVYMTGDDGKPVLVGEHDPWIRIW